MWSLRKCSLIQVFLHCNTNNTKRRWLMFKRSFLAVFLFLVLASVGFAGEETIVHDGTLTAQTHSSSDAFVYRSHICESTSSDCDVPDKYVFGTPKLRVRFWAPATQGYARHYIITDSQGTMVGYQYFYSSMSSGWNDLALDYALPNGDYEFIFISAGDDGRTAVSDPYKFSVY